MVAKERIPISSERTSMEVQADGIVVELGRNAQVITKVNIARLPEETKSKQN